MKLPSPCYVINLDKLIDQAKLCHTLHQACGVNILLALKAFSLPEAFLKLNPYLQGASVSSYNEARLASNFFGNRIHFYSPALKKEVLLKFLGYISHLNLNSFSQFEQFKDILFSSPTPVSLGLRVNPMFSSVKTACYNPCTPKSRFGVCKDQFDSKLFKYFEGLHVHAMCEQYDDALIALVESIESQFSEALKQAKWLNLGGGQLLCSDQFDRGVLIQLVNHLRSKYDLDIFMEPGEGIVSQTGHLECRVVDIIFNDGAVAILDASAANHAPDSLEMPYRIQIEGSGLPGEKAYQYRLGGPTCLSGDLFGDYSFDTPLKIGQKLVMQDMAQYSFVKSNFFNGVEHPSIAIQEKNKPIKLVKQFGYEDFISKLSTTMKGNHILDSDYLLNLKSN